MEEGSREPSHHQLPYSPCHPLCLMAKPETICPFPVGSFRPIAPVKSLVSEAATRDQKMAFYLEGGVRREAGNQSRILPFVHTRKAPDAVLLGGGRGQGILASGRMCSPAQPLSFPVSSIRAELSRPCVWVVLPTPTPSSSDTFNYLESSIQRPGLCTSLGVGMSVDKECMLSAVLWK